VVGCNHLLCLLSFCLAVFASHHRLYGRCNALACTPPQQLLFPQHVPNMAVSILQQLVGVVVKNWFAS
jgi:hypothetical protein